MYTDAKGIYRKKGMPQRGSVYTQARGLPLRDVRVLIRA